MIQQFLRLHNSHKVLTFSSQVYTEIIKANFLSMGLDYNWGSMVSWSWGVVWGWSWVVWLSFWVYWDTFVADIGDESGVVISLVCDSLYTAIGKVDLVRSAGDLAI